MKLLVANMPRLIRTPRRFSDVSLILFHLMSRVNVTVFQQQAIHSPLPLDIFHLAEGEGGKRRKTWIIISPLSISSSRPPLRTSNVFTFRNYAAAAATGGNGGVLIAAKHAIEKAEEGNEKLCGVHYFFLFDFAPYFLSYSNYL